MSFHEQALFAGSHFMNDKPGWHSIGKPVQNGLRVEVKNNNVDFALRKFKRMVKDSGMMLELKKKSYYEKPSKVKREKKNLQKLRYKYKNLKENNTDY